MGGLAEVEAKLELVRRVEAEHRFGVVIGEPRELEPIPGIPEGVIEVFSLFDRLRGDGFVFRRPAEIESPEAWEARDVNPHCPLGSPLVIGSELGGPDKVEAAPVNLDLDDGSVYYCDPDEYVFAYKNVEVEEVEIEEFAPGIVTFFDEFVLGERYPRLVEVVLGSAPVTRRDRKGRPRDAWMRLLLQSGLVPASE
ncbi:hypothetical protein [Actinomadura rugatobispora]|uniref:SMI1/KNR4 family protein n=1 Tax=Actinomadura rugatobispora TaxID=1994 RepID=A0ABW1ABY7_9ACTN